MSLQIKGRVGFNAPGPFFALIFDGGDVTRGGRHQENAIVSFCWTGDYKKVRKMAIFRAGFWGVLSLSYNRRTKMALRKVLFLG